MLSREDFLSASKPKRTVSEEKDASKIPATNRDGNSNVQPTKATSVQNKAVVLPKMTSPKRGIDRSGKEKSSS